MSITLIEILADIKRKPVKLHKKPAPKVEEKLTPRGCRWCNCFLSIKREDPTGFHIKNHRGEIEYVIVYHGKAICLACHKYQVPLVEAKV